MPWSEAQNRRLEQEEKILEDYFPKKVKWINRNDADTKVEVQMTSNSNKSYTLRACIQPDYPNSCPDLLVSNPPRPLKDKQGKELECGTDNHSYGTKHGLTTICHFVPTMWTNEYTLYQVFMKGRIWLEAYEIYQQTGKPIKTYLREMPCNLPMEDILAAIIARTILERLTQGLDEERPSPAVRPTEPEKPKANSGCSVM
jgi:hypothetical protein